MKKTERDGLYFLEQDGPKLGWSEASGVELIEQDGHYFKDLERTGALLPYEDWRLSAKERAKDLASRMTIAEIAGLMLYSPHQMVPPRKGMPFTGTFGGKEFEESGCAPWAISDEQKEFLQKEHIRHILLMRTENVKTSAKWSNGLQQMAESLPHGIPVNISSDPRSGARGVKAEFKSSGSDVSKWPEGIGFAACFDPGVVRQFAEDASKEYRAMGITTALGPQIDLATEPRWMRFCDTLGVQMDQVKALTKAYCDGMQTTAGAADGWGKDSVNTMVKHWPGGGTGEGGRDAHYAFGKYAVYPGGQFAEHVKPFTEAAFALDGATKQASAVMPYYTVSWNIDTKNGRNVGNSYSDYIIGDLLRGKYGYDGIVCTDWGITQDPAETVNEFGSRCYGMEQVSEAERHLRAIEAGVDQFGGNSEAAPIIEAYRIGCERHGEAAMRARMEQSAARLLVNLFHLGLFENPYLDPERSAQIAGCEEFCRHGYEAQKQSVVLLKNKGVLPLKKGIRVYVPERSIGASIGFFRNEVPAYTEDPVAGGVLDDFAVRVSDPAEADVALVFVESPQCNPYQPEDLQQGGNGYFPVTLQYRPYTARTARKQSLAGGDFRESSDDRNYWNKTNTAYNEQDLDLILECRRQMPGKPVIVVAAVSNPMVMGEFEPQADGIAVEFGVSKRAVLEVLFGDYAPRGRLPIQMPRDMETVEQHAEDRQLDLAPYVDSEGNAYDYGFGLTYETDSAYDK